MLCHSGPCPPPAAFLQNSAVLAVGPRLSPESLLPGVGQMASAVSCVNLDQRLISHYSWSALEEGAQPFTQQMEKLRPREVTFMPKVSQSVGSGARVWALGLLTFLPLSL